MKKIDFNIVRELIEGDLVIKSNIQFNNIDAGSVIITEHVTVRLFGQIENLVLEQGSRVFMHGLIRGRVENHGGELHIFPN